MSSHYANYIKEREGFGIVEDSRGFATYKISGEECYIKDIFVKKEFRQKNVASEFADQIAEIAKEAGCKFLTGTVCPQAEGATTSLTVLLRYGFKLLSSKENLIIFIKEII